MSLPEPAVAYRIDGDDRIVEVNEGWVAFAEQNGGEALVPARGYTRDL